MTVVSDVFTSLWRSAKHVGRARPTQTVRVRKGHFRHAYEHWTSGSIPVGARIPGESEDHPWQATWTPEGDWVDLDQVLQVDLDHTFDNKGVQGATMQVENVFLVEQSTLGRVWHMVVRGLLSPYRGYRPSGRPEIGDKTEWYELLHSESEVIIEQGYGEEQVIVFNGLIDKADEVSRPDRITVTMRCFGKNLSDQDVFGHAKSKQIYSPITFADRYFADDTDKVGGGAGSSSVHLGHPARFVCDKSKDSAWQSSADDDHPYVEIRLPRGRYASFEILPDRANMKAYISVYARSDRKLRAEMDGEAISEGWVDVGKGEAGGVPFVKNIESVKKDGRIYRISDDHDFQLGENSILRVHFRDLPEGGDGKRRAGVRSLFALKRSRKQDAKDRRWILVEDWSDVVKVVLRWAGFKEWEVETSGARLGDNLLVFHAGDKLIDIITKVAEFLNYAFYIREPEDEDSIGIPVFRTVGALRSGNLGKSIQLVRDTDLLTAIQASFDPGVLPFNIRVRGVEKKVGTAGTKALGSDPTNRPHYHFRPPWQDRLAGVLRHSIHTSDQIETAEECKRACYLIGLESSLKSVTGSIEIPGNPVFELDEQLAVYDVGTGMSTRLYIATRQSTFITGKQASWKMTLGGSFLDVPDTQKIIWLLWKLDADDDSPQSYPQVPRISKGEVQALSG